MRRLTDLPLFWQLFVPMLAVVAMWAVTAFIAVEGLTESRTLMHGLYTNNVTMVFRLERLKRDFADHNRLLLQHMATESAALMGKLISRMAEVEARLETDLRDLETARDRSAGGEDLRRAFRAYLASVRSVLKLSADFEKEAAFAAFNRETQESLSEANTYLTVLTDMEAHTMGAAYNRSLELEHRNAVATTLASFIALAVSVLLLFAVARHTAKRLRLVADAAQSMGSGNLATRTGAWGWDEVGTLGRNLDQMAEELQRTMGQLEDVALELRKAHGELEQKVMERTWELEDEIKVREETEKNLLEAKEQAESANRAKSDFLANMSHELRTPLNAIIGFTEVSLAEVFGPLQPKYREYSENVRDSGLHLLGLINDILDMSKIEAGNLELDEETVDPEEVIADCIRLVRAQARDGQAEIIEKSGPPDFTLRGDRRRIKQVLVNLLSNAAKFTPETGRIIVSLDRLADGRVALAVVDDGIGMTAEEAVRAQEPFGQVDASLSRRHEGTGLGLPLARKLMEEHGGTLEVDSTKGVGTSVTAYFPSERVVGA